MYQAIRGVSVLPEMQQPEFVIDGGIAISYQQMNHITLLGLTAGALTTISLLPQVVKIWNSKSAKDISFGMYSILCTGLLLWIFYGFFIDSLPVVITNIFSFILACIILALKTRYG